MADTIIVYSKQHGEPLVPVTVRLAWLPDGIIIPSMYWMPDGSCYEVSHVYEMTPLAFMKDRGEGIRFEVKAVVLETPEAYSDFPFTCQNTYLYFVDNWFCGKNFIDGRYSHKAKDYIPVVLDVFPNGEYELVYFWVHGTRYMVEKTIAVEPRGSFNAGGVGIWHKVKARQVNTDNDDDPDPTTSIIRMAALYFEVNKWFVMKATNDGHTSVQ